MRRRSAALVGACAAAAVAGVLDRRPPEHPRWSRRNYRDTSVTLAAGPALAAGAASAAAVAGAPSAAVVALLAGSLGLYDDLYGDSHARGLRGHWQALRSGRLTTGLVKLAGLVVVGAVVARRQRHAGPGAALDVVLVAGSANLINLLDLRPGRALKATAAAAAAGLTTQGCAGAAAAGLGAAAMVMLPADLAERSMLGDCGANAAGATLGWLAATALRPGGRVVVATGVVGLTLVSEAVSFTEVFERTGWLRAIDEWGRQP